MLNLKVLIYYYTILKREIKSFIINFTTQFLTQ